MTRSIKSSGFENNEKWADAIIFVPFVTGLLKYVHASSGTVKGFPSFINRLDFNWIASLEDHQLQLLGKDVHDQYRAVIGKEQFIINQPFPFKVRLLFFFAQTGDTFILLLRSIPLDPEKNGIFPVEK